MRRGLILAALLTACSADGSDESSEMCGAGRSCRDGGSTGNGSRPDAWEGVGEGTRPDAQLVTDGGGVSADGSGTRPDGSRDGGSPANCGGETFVGRCDGNGVVWCDGHVVHHDTCPAGTSCQFNSEYYDCLSVPYSGGCGGVGYEGDCIDDYTLVWCEGGVLHQFECPYPTYCEWSTYDGLYDCY